MVKTEFFLHLLMRLIVNRARLDGGRECAQVGRCRPAGEMVFLLSGHPAFADEPNLVCPLALIRCGGPSAPRAWTTAKRALSFPFLPMRQLMVRHVTLASMSSAGTKRMSGMCRRRGGPRLATDQQKKHLLEAIQTSSSLRPLLGERCSDWHWTSLNETVLLARSVSSAPCPVRTAGRQRGLDHSTLRRQYTEFCRSELDLPSCGHQQLHWRGVVSSAPNFGLENVGLNPEDHHVLSGSRTTACGSACAIRLLQDLAPSLFI